MDPGIGTLVKRSPIEKYQEDPTEPAFKCAQHCHNSTECTHWGVKYESNHKIWCELKKQVMGEMFNPYFKVSGNRLCRQGSTLSAGKDSY